MSKKNRNAAIERKINTVKAAALAVKSDEDDIPDQLFDDVEWIVDRSKEHKLYDLLDNPILTAPARKSIEFALVEAGYRYYSFAQDIKTKEETLAVVLPFAVLFTIIASTGDIPVELDGKTTKAIAEKKLFRKAFNIGGNPTVLTEPRLYPIDRFEWSSESQVRSYLKCVLNHTQGISPTVLPLIGDYTKKPGYSGLPPAPDNKDSAIVGIRALCSCVIADIGDANRADENLFEMVESIDDSWTKDLKEILEHDLMQKGITNPQISVFPLPCQLYEVPKTGHRIHRDFKIDLMIEAAKSKLLKISEHGVPLQPVIYISDIVEDGIVTEIKLRGYAGDNRKDAFFQYDHIVAHQWEKPGDVLALINDIVGQLGAIPIYLQNGDSEN